MSKPSEKETNDAIKMFVKGLTQEALNTYTVADSSELDWCPCCGINLRLYDEDGELFAKWILNEDIAKNFAFEVLRIINQRQKFIPTPEAKAELVSRMEAAVTDTLIHSNVTTEKHIRTENDVPCPSCFDYELHGNTEPCPKHGTNTSPIQNEEKTDG